jgi:hypothetical protein
MAQSTLRDSSSNQLGERAGGNCKSCGQPLSAHTERIIRANDPPEKLILREYTGKGGILCTSATVEQIFKQEAGK